MRLTANFPRPNDGSAIRVGHANATGMLIPRDLARLDPFQRAYVDDLRRANESRRSVFESAIAAEHEKLARDPGDGAAWLKVAKLQYRFELYE